MDKVELGRRPHRWGPAVGVGRGAVVAGLGLGLGCAGPAPAPQPPSGPLEVATLSWPVHRMAHALRAQARLDGAEGVRLRCHLPAGVDPPDWSPKRAELEGLLEAELILANGAGYETWLATASLPGGRLVDTATAVPPVEQPERHHQHGDQPAHSHGSQDPHSWVDPAMAAVQLAAIAEAWSAARPAWSGALDAAVTQLTADLQARDEALGAALAPLAARGLAANHPSHGHLARHHGLSIRAFDLAPTTPPAAAARAAVEDWVTGAGPRPVLLWESRPADPVVAALPDVVQHVVFDTLEAPVGDAEHAPLRAPIDQNIAVLRALSSHGP